MRASILFSTDTADAVADALLVRRLTNAGLALIAIWATVFALSGWENWFDSEWWVFAAAIVITCSTLGFAAWTATFGDRKAWRRAFNKSRESDSS